VHPQHVRKEALAGIDIVITVGKDPHETMRDFCHSLGIDEPPLEPVTLQRWEVLVWFRHSTDAPFVVTVQPGKTEHKRHIRKYTEGDLGVGSFVFTGPEHKLQLSAQNLNTFIRIGAGVDNATWRHHLLAHHFSEWFRWIIKDQTLADEVKSIEDENPPADQSRERIFAAVRARYTAPA
jgi:hypothetical protein